MIGGRGSGWHIALEAAPSAADFGAIFTPLDRETAAIAGACDLRPLALLLRDAEGAVRGGLWARITYGWLVVEMIYVPPDCRGAGLGRALMQRAEAEARARGCVGLHITRLDFQAPAFYERLGFTVFGVQEDVPPGHRCFFMARRVDGRAAVNAV